MKKLYKFLFRFIAWATGLFLLWYFFLQRIYILLLSKIIVLISPITSFGKLKLLNSDSMSATFGVYSANEAYKIDEASIVSGIIFLLASFLASGIIWKFKFKWIGIGSLFSMFFHILANILIISMYAHSSSTIEGFKIFIDGILLMALPIFIWGFAIVFEKNMKLENILFSEGKK